MGYEFITKIMQTAYPAVKKQEAACPAGEKAAEIIKKAGAEEIQKLLDAMSANEKASLSIKAKSGSMLFQSPETALSVYSRKSAAADASLEKTGITQPKPPAHNLMLIEEPPKPVSQEVLEEIKQHKEKILGDNNINFNNEQIERIIALPLPLKHAE